MARQLLKKKTLWRVSVTTIPEAEEAVAELLARQFDQTASIYTNIETQLSAVTVFPQIEKPKTAEIRAALSAGLADIAACGLKVGAGEITVSKVRKEDWTESWKKFFKPLEFGRHLLIRPGWSKRKAKQGQAVVVLDPGLSFGTGQHATTGFCLKQIVEHRPRNGAASFLDIGTGSGILAICAARMGYAPVEAFDYDPQSVKVALDNAKRNRVAERLTIRKQDLTKLPVASRRKHDFVCANLTWDLHIEWGGTIVNRIKPGGHVVLAGILEGQFPAVQAACEKRGLVLLEAVTEKEWRSGIFQLRA